VAFSHSVSKFRCSMYLYRDIRIAAKSNEQTN
jgi:hypothetical protein